MIQQFKEKLGRWKKATIQFAKKIWQKIKDFVERCIHTLGSLF